MENTMKTNETKPPFKPLDAGELLSQPAAPARALIAEELETAARILRANPGGERDDSAAWRVADAGLKLRRKVERSGIKDVPGVDMPTRMGALLPEARPGRADDTLTAEQRQRLRERAIKRRKAVKP
jgi:hypothetical protein